MTDFDATVDKILYNVYLAGWNDKLNDRSPSYSSDEMPEKRHAKASLYKAIEEQLIGEDEPSANSIDELFYGTRNGLRRLQRNLLHKKGE